MSSQKNVSRQYEQALIGAYYDSRMHEILDPLFDAFQQWKAGHLSHDELTELIHKVHRENQRAYSFFTQSRKTIVLCVKMDNDWFDGWLRENPPPPGVEL